MLAALLGIFGCATSPSNCKHVPVPDSSRMQGSWTGHEAGNPAEGKCQFIIIGNKFEFHGTGDAAGEWYKGTFTLKEDANPKQFIATITDTSLPQYKGQVSLAIYKFDGAKFIMTANEPGKTEAPAGFDSSDSRAVEFSK